MAAVHDSPPGPLQQTAAHHQLQKQQQRLVLLLQQHLLHHLAAAGVDCCCRLLLQQQLLVWWELLVWAWEQLYAVLHLQKTAATTHLDLLSNKQLLGMCGRLLGCRGSHGMC
jgi:hypothetical protein